MIGESRLSIKDKLAGVSNIITVQNSSQNSSFLGARSKQQIEEWLEADASHLITKKQRQKLKKQRLKLLQQQFEIKRQKKQQAIQNKLTASQKLKIKNIESIQQKLKKVSTRHQSVFGKVQHQKSQELRKKYQQRKLYETDKSDHNSKFSSQSKDQRLTTKQIKSGTRPINPEDSIEKHILEINQKIQKANKNNKEIKQVALQKLRQHNNGEIMQAQAKANELLEHQIKKYKDKIVHKIDNAIDNKQKVDKLIEKKHQQIQKMYSEKWRKYHSNIQHLNEQSLSKYEELNKKFQKKTDPKKWKDEKSQIYHKRFLSNYEMIEEQKVKNSIIEDLSSKLNYAQTPINHHEKQDLQIEKRQPLQSYQMLTQRQQSLINFDIIILLLK